MSKGKREAKKNRRKREKNMKKITREFAEKVIAERVVDTKTYRYFAGEQNGEEKITRCKIAELDTTAALKENRETVAIAD